MEAPTSDTLGALLIIFVTLFIWNWFIVPYWKWRIIPGPPGNFLLGHVIELAKKGDEMLQWAEKTSQQYPRLQKIFFGPKVDISLSHPETIKKVFKSSSQLSKGWVYKYLHPWLGQGLLTSTGDKWKKQRRMLTPAFHFKILQGYADITSSLVDTFNDALLKTNGESVDIVPLIKNLTLDILGLCAFGIDLKAQTDPLNEYVQAIQIVGDLVIDRVTALHHYFDWVYRRAAVGKKFYKELDILHGYTEDVIRRRQQEHQEGRVEERKHKDFLDLLLEARGEDGDGLSFEEIREQVDTFMFEGHDTTAHGISWTLYLIAQHRDVQTRLQEEADRVYGERDNIGHSDIKQLEYTQSVLYESHRLYPPVPFIARTLDEDLEVDGHVLPKGTGVTIRVYSLHRNPDLWKDHLKFDPDRFSKDKLNEMDTFAFVPFAAGARNCIGQNFALNEEKIVISKIMRKFDLSVDEKHKVEPDARLVLVPLNGIKLRATLRKK